MPAKKEEKEEKLRKIYCGVAPVPTNSDLGTPSQCLSKNQVRYYGRIAINKNLLKEHLEGKKSSNLLNEQLKLKKMEADAKILLNEIKKSKLILEREDTSEARVKRYRTKLRDLLKKRDRLLVKYKKQKEIVKTVDREKKREAKEKEKEKAKKKKKSKD